jgi:glycolate oxidase FAD binding subunit
VDSPPLTIDDFGPLPVRRPATVAELRAVVAESSALYPVGGRTTLDVGLPPTRPGVAVDMTALSAVIDYPARDMTFTVQAGVTVAALQAALAKEGQWLPIDVANPERSTVGGAVALNKSGPRRFGYGTLRDYVIGISFVADDATEVKAGGRVVKNVAGYDLMKVQVGAVGTLGIISQVTLKVKPKPEASATLAFGCASGELGAVLDLLHASKSRPVAVEVLNRAAWPDAASDWTVLVGFEEKATTVKWQRETLLAELKRDAAEVPADVWERITALQIRLESRAVFKVNVRPSKVAELLSAVAPLGELVHAEPLNGILWVHAPESLSPEFDRTLVRIGEAAQASGGNMVVRRGPTEWKRRVSVWGAPRGDWEMMRHLKRTLDPRNVFNPGRLFAEGEPGA